MSDRTQKSGVPSKKRRFTWVGAVCVLIALAVGGYFWLSEKQLQTPGGPPEVLVLAAETSLLPATVWVAEKQGFFHEEGLEVNIREFDSGRNALESMLVDDSVDMVTVAQTPVVYNSSYRGEFVIIASMAYSIDEVKVLARRDSEIQTPFDLIGKRVGVTLRSTGQYFLEGFLDHYGLSSKDVDLVDVDAETMKVELLDGRLDAITTWEPHIYNTVKALGEENVVLMMRPTLFRKDFYFVARSDYAKRNKETLKKFLRAVIRAEEFIRKHPEESQFMVANRLGIDREIVVGIWDRFSFDVSLRQSSLRILESMRGWAIEHGYHDGDISNYLDIVDWCPLREVDNARVTVTLPREASR